MLAKVDFPVAISPVISNNFFHCIFSFDSLLKIIFIVFPSAQTAGSDNRSDSLSASHDVLQSTVDIVSVIDKCGNLSGKSLFCTSYETGRKRTGTE